MLCLLIPPHAWMDWACIGNEIEWHVRANWLGEQALWFANYLGCKSNALLLSKLALDSASVAFLSMINCWCHWNVFVQLFVLHTLFAETGPLSVASCPGQHEQKQQFCIPLFKDASRHSFPRAANISIELSQYYYMFIQFCTYEWIHIFSGNVYKATDSQTFYWSVSLPVPIHASCCT